MKKLIVALMAVGLLGAVPVLAAHHESKAMDPKEEVRQCALQAESIQQKIARIQKEIKKGSKAYSAEDLNKLEDKLKEANKILEELNKN